MATGVMTAAQAETAMTASASTLVFLFALFVFAGALDGAGVLDHLARWILSRPRRPADLPFDLFVGIGILSALMVNDAQW